MPPDLKPDAEARYCPNCHYPMRSGAVFCSECGQKYTTGRVALWQLFRAFLGALFEIDSRIFRTLRDIFVPGKLTEEYFKGRHRRYVHPTRVFLFTALLHFAVLSFLLSDLKEMITGTMEERKREAHYGSFLQEMDSLQEQVLLQYPGAKDVERALDSLRARMGDADRDSVGIIHYMPQNQSFETKKIAASEVYDMRAEPLLDKYGIEGLVPRFVAGQNLRIYTEGNNFFAFMLGNLIWLVALMMPSLGLLLKLLYIRRNRYFVEHLIFSFHYHAFAFFIFTVVFLLNIRGIQLDATGTAVDANVDKGIIEGFIIVLIYLFFAMRRVYAQGYIKTFLKFCIVNFSYLFIFTVSLVLTLAVGALLF